MNSKVTVGTVVGLLLAAVGIVVPIVWDWYKGKTTAEVQFLSSATIIENGINLEKLQISYAGKPIRSLTKVGFAFVNTGKTPIVQEQLKVPPTVNFGTNAEVLDVTIDARVPQNLDATANVLGTKNGVMLSFPLLNPGDSFTFSVLLSGTLQKPTASARIVNVKDVQVVDHRAGVSNKKIDWKVYLVGAVSLLFFGAGFSMIGDLRRNKKAKRLFTPGLNLPVPDNSDHYRGIIGAFFSSRSSSELQSLRDAIDQIKGKPTSEQHQEVMAQLYLLAANPPPTGAGIFMAFLLATVGTIFVVSKFF